MGSSITVEALLGAAFGSPALIPGIVGVDTSTSTSATTTMCWFATAAYTATVTTTSTAANCNGVPSASTTDIGSRWLYLLVLAHLLMSQGVGLLVSNIGLPLDLGFSPDQSIVVVCK